MPPLLLVHGGWNDRRCWDLALPFLAELGIEAHTVTMPGNGASKVSPFCTNMKRHGQAICAKIREIGRPTAILGHSMGGYSISAAAQACPDLITQMIFLTAWVPERLGFNMYQMDKMYGPVITGPTVHAASIWKPWFGVIDADREKAGDFLCPLARLDSREFLLSRMCPQPIRPGLSHVPWTDERMGAIPKAYIECSEDVAIPLDGQRHFQTNAEFERVTTIPGDHSSFVSMPQVMANAVADVLR